MGGRIAVRSTPGEGSVFEVWLEAAAEQHTRIRNARSVLETLTGGLSPLTTGRERPEGPD